MYYSFCNTQVVSAICKLQYMDAVELHDNNAGSFRKRYDDKNSFKDRLAVWKNLFTKYIGTGKSVIELGCGPGLMAKAVVGMGNTLHAIDGSAKMIERARKEVGPSPNIQFTESYLSVAFLSGFGTSSFDGAISSSVLEYIEDANGIINEAKRILKPGGVFIFSVPNKQSLYRITETVTYKLFGKPGYRKFLHSQYSVADIKALENNGWKLEELIFQGTVPYYSAITSFLPGKYQNPMLLVVLRKK